MKEISLERTCSVFMLCFTAASTLFLKMNDLVIEKDDDTYTTIENTGEIHDEQRETQKDTTVIIGEKRRTLTIK